ncbi:alcohol dehydrogenase catalytic domain-containing protein [Actinomadura luteofluorescens]|uniref:alcohol dehydrogenase catalytic domain-containing protein n=1 Tax=Actinomadura luteofluorescens TaxID=46163 RepID=UPI003635CAB8
MKAVRFHEYGDPEVLRYEDVDLPVPGAGQVQVRVAATTFNGVDGNIRAGFMQDPMPLALPHIPGLDVAGTVDALGEGVGGLEIGDRIVGFLPFVDDGAAAEYVLAPAEILARSDEHPARRRGRAAPGRSHRVAGALRPRRTEGRAADPDQWRGRSRGRLRGAAGQGGRCRRHRHRQPSQHRARQGGGRR